MMASSLRQFFFSIFPLFFALSSVLCHGRSDLEALMKLKASLLGPNGSGLDDWDPSSSSPSSHYCSFSGVTCDEESRVTALNVSKLPLFGSIPPEIGLLNRLVNLTIVSSNLTGILPLEMANLTSLKLFNISNNMFTGGFPGEITLTMAGLEVIDAYNNNFTGSLPIEFVKLKKLRHLHIGGNYFSGIIPEKYSELQSLEYLGLSANSLNGKIPASLARLKSLKEMYVGYVNSYDGGIPPQLGLATSLQVLDMGGCNLTGKIPKSLGLLKNLQTLFLQMNRLSGQIPSELSGLVSLQCLDLSFNNITGEIPESLSHLKNLSLINLFKNNIYGRIPEFIGELPNLEVFQVWENNLTSHLPENLGRNGKLKYLDVMNNRLTGMIPGNLCKGGRLEALILSQNSFLGPIPDELGQCKSLKRIRIMKNYLNGTIPAGIFMLPNVTIIELSDNRFSGELPAKISGNSLKILKLSNNWISGKIPPAIGNLVNLRTLSLKLNRFDGEIPSQIFDLASMSKINVSANNLNGKIPASIARCRSLTSLDFSRNSFFGEVPKGISNLKVLSLLNFSRNNLTGQIPSEIQAMTSLTTLDLSYNNLSGKVPFEGQLRYFSDLSFEGNPHLCLPNNAVCRSSSRPHKVFHSYKPNLVIIGVATPLSFSVLSLILFVVYATRNKNLQKPKPWKLTAFKRLKFKAEDVLECLKEENIVGRGGAGIVFRGSMPDGSNIAIKQLGRQTSGRMWDYGFSAEIRTLRQIRHRYIVRLLGYVTNKETNLLLYEYMPNGSLGELLHGSNAQEVIQWEMRYKIAWEVAKGLCYLHHDCSPRIIHRDVKSNNILLDSQMEAHVADFGLAKFLQDDGASDFISSIVGTFGYIAPEYTRTLKVDEKSDVYSFGVVLLELVTGEKPVREFDEGVNIVGWVRKTTSELSQPSDHHDQDDDAAKVLAILDPRLTGYPLTSVIRLFRVAMMCVRDDSSARPTMRDVVHMLTNPSGSQSDESLNV